MVVSGADYLPGGLICRPARQGSVDGLDIDRAGCLERMTKGGRRLVHMPKACPVVHSLAIQSTVLTMWVSSVLSGASGEHRSRDWPLNVLQGPLYFRNMTGRARWTRSCEQPRRPGADGGYRITPGKLSVIVDVSLIEHSFDETLRPDHSVWH